MQRRLPLSVRLAVGRTTRALITASLGATLLASVAIAPAATAQTPVAHWTFDDGIANYDTTTVVDIVNGNDAVWQNGNAEEGFNTGALSYTPGVLGGAARLSGGTNNFFLVPSIPQIDGVVATPEFGGGDPVLGVGITWSAWINVDVDNGSTNQGVLVGRTVTDEALAGEGTNQNWGMNWANGSIIDSRVSGQQLNSPAASIVRGQWHHLALVWGNVDDQAAFILPAQRLYIDGALVSEDIDTEVFEFISSGSWLIGEDSCCNGREFDGLLDDFAVFASALSSAEVLALYNNGLAGVNASGVSTSTILPGDVDQSGTVDTADFGIIRDNLGKSVTARNLGDLDGNRRVDLNDFQSWLDLVPPALAAEALASYSANVPEPSGLALSVLMSLAAGLSCQRSRRPS